jgi:hypothetical protein
LYEGNQFNPSQETFYKATNKNTPAYSVGSNIEMGYWALLGDDDVFEITKDSNGLPKLIDENIETSHTKDGEVISYSFTYEYTFKGIDEHSSIVRQIMAWFSSYEPDIDKRKVEPKDPVTNMDPIINSSIDTKFKKDLVSLMKHEDMAQDKKVYNSLYYAGLLRVDAVKAMRKRDFAKMLSTQLDTGYTIKSATWSEKIMAGVLILIAIAISVLSAGAATGVAISFTATWIGAFAGALAISLSIASLVLNQIGGLSTNGLVKVIGNFAQIVGIVGIIAGITAFIQNIYEKAVQQAIAQAAAEEGGQLSASAASKVAESVSMTDVVNFAIDEAVNQVKSMFTSTSNFTVDKAFSFVSDAIKAYKKYIYDPALEEEKAKLKAETEQLDKDIEQFEADAADRNLFNHAVYFEMMHEDASLPDTITDMEKEMRIKLFGTKSYRNWCLFVGHNS